MFLVKGNHDAIARESRRNLGERSGDTNSEFCARAFEAAELLRVSQLTIQRWAAARAFPVLRYMKHLRFRRDDLIRFAEGRVRPAADPERYAASQD